MSSPLILAIRRRAIQRTTAIRRALSAMDLVAPGSLITRTKVCGRPNCRCAIDPAARHGPYYEWSRRAGGRLLHHILTEEQAEAVAVAIGNRREIDRLLSQWEVVTLEEILALANKEADS